MTEQANNPRRIAGQLRGMIRSRTRNLWWLSLLFIFPLLALIVCLYFSASAWLIALCGIASVSGIIQFLADLNQLVNWKRRLKTIELDGNLDSEE